MTQYKQPKLKVSDKTSKLLDRFGYIPEKKISNTNIFGRIVLSAAILASAYTWALSGKDEGAYVASDNATGKNYSIEQVCQADNSQNKSNLENILDKPRVRQLKVLNEQYPLSEEQIRGYIKTAIQTVPNLSPEITPDFVRYIIRIESTDNPNAVSPTGARGLGQLTEAAWMDRTQESQSMSYIDKDGSEAKLPSEGLPYDYAFDPYVNVEMTVRHLDWVAKHAENGNPKWDLYCKTQRQNQAAAAYNGGPTALKNVDYDIGKMRAETRGYVKKLEKMRKQGIKRA